MLASMMRRSPMLGRTAVAAPMMSPMLMGPAQAPILCMATCAGFAKYQRTKPHLNVGTIGKSSARVILWTLNALQFTTNLLSSVQVTLIMARRL